MNDTLLPFFKQLQKSTKQVLSDEIKQYDLVMGNESMDIDSLVSSLTYAYYRFNLFPHRPVVIALNLKQETLKQKTHLLSLLKLCKLSDSHFVFAPDLHTLALQNIKLHLVDHHQLASHQQFLTQRVSGFIDHHHQEKVHYPNLKYQYLKPCASCATLIWQIFNDKNISYQEPLMANLFLSALYMDTFFFTHPEKITPQDEKAYLALKPHASMPLSFFQKLKSQSIPNLKLPFESKLQWDLKSYEEKNSKLNSIRYALCSFPLPLSFERFAEEKGEEKLKKLCKKNQWSFFLLLFTAKDKTKPTLLGYTPDKASDFFSKIKPDLSPLLLPKAPLFPSSSLFLAPLIPYCSRKALKANLKVKDIDI